MSVSNAQASARGATIERWELKTLTFIFDASIARMMLRRWLSRIKCRDVSTLMARYCHRGLSTTEIGRCHSWTCFGAKRARGRGGGGGILSSHCVCAIVRQGDRDRDSARTCEPPPQAADTVCCVGVSILNKTGQVPDIHGLLSC